MPQPTKKPNLIYHVAKDADWTLAQTSGSYKVASLETQGFIHLSTQEQVLESAQLHFKPEDAPLWLLQVSIKKLGDELRWEPSRGGALFPHLYSALPLDAITTRAPLERDANGQFIWPDDWSR